MSSIESFISIACGSVLPVLMFNKLIFFIIYKLTRNACIIDIGYTVGHLLAGIVYAYRLTTFDFGTMIKLTIVTIWCFRLAGFLLVNRIMVGYHDPRYELVFKKYPQNSLRREIAVLFQYIFQGFIVLITSSTLYWFFLNETQSQWLSINNIALMFSIIAITLEAISDQQLQNFKNKVAQYPKGSIFQGGLWKKSRHPNLFFELSTWFLFALTGFQQLSDIPTFLGPVALFFVMDRLTIPLTERHLKRTRGETFIEYQKNTNKYYPF